MKSCLDVCNTQSDYSDLKIDDWVKIKDLKYERLSMPVLVTCKNLDVKIICYIESMSTTKNFTDRSDFTINLVDVKRGNTNLHSIFGWNQALFTVDEINEEIEQKKYLIKEYNESVIEDSKKLVAHHEFRKSEDKDEEKLKEKIKAMKLKQINQCYSLYNDKFRIIALYKKRQINNKVIFEEALKAATIMDCHNWKIYWAICNFNGFYIHLPAVYLTAIF